MIALETSEQEVGFEFATHEEVKTKTNTLQVVFNHSPDVNSAAPQQQADAMVAQYFGDVRQHALLSRTEEQTLWGDIEHYKRRLRRALYMMPLALATLTRMWRQAEVGDISLQQIISDETSDHASAGMPQTDLNAQLESAIVSLEQQHMAIQQLRIRLRSTAGSASERRQTRQQWRALWQQWIATWEALNLHAHLHEAITFALQTAYAADPSSVPLRSAYAAWQRAQRQLTQAEDHMLRANLRLVIYVANRYRGRGVPLLDLIQEGNIGLMRALGKFRPDRGVKFATYAHWWVRQAISRSLMEQNRTVRLPVYVAEHKNKLQTITDRLWNVNGREPSIQELSDAIGWTAQEVADTQSVGQPMVCLHASVTEDGRVLADLLEDADTPPLETWQAHQELHQLLTDCLDHLTEREAFVIRLRYGLDADSPQTLQEIADHLGLSRERVRQIEKKALEKLRQSHNYAVLADFVEA